ncbi:MAG: AbrB/MazE/SpoVT family DNA-binding domain-containing protein [Nanoarchaeota archaeon]|nr:AbrB/MazE/SpoVT family DNA-binding domain-containing protein [Nanoarchaeota archaeon]
MIAKMKLGEKGQVVIPKIFRENYNLSPGDTIFFEDKKDHIEIRKKESNILKVAEKIRKYGEEYRHQTAQEIKKEYKDYLSKR